MLWLAKPTECGALTPRQSAEEETRLFYIPSPGAAPPSLCLEEPWHSYCSWFKALVLKGRREQTAAPHSGTPCPDQKTSLCRTGALLPSASAQPPGPQRGTAKPPARARAPAPAAGVGAPPTTRPCPGLWEPSPPGPPSHPSQPSLQSQPGRCDWWPRGPRAGLPPPPRPHCLMSLFLAEQCQPDFGSNPRYRLVLALLHGQEAAKGLITASSAHPSAKRTS